MHFTDISNRKEGNDQESIQLPNTFRQLCIYIYDIEKTKIPSIEDNHPFRDNKFT